ncbi:MAG: hypothetical protein L0H63_12145, partial [Nitrococcus sp.]|nr:hypothetical protein [Nitrococcus sp.]
HGPPLCSPNTPPSPTPPPPAPGAPGGPRRGPPSASRVALGAVVGIGVYLADQIVASAGMLLDLSPPLIALGPSVILLVVALAALGKAQ